MTKEELNKIAELLRITGELGGEMSRTSTYDHNGRTSKKITIEYDVKQEKRVSST